MDKEKLAETVEKCGSEAQDAVDREALFDDRRERRTLAAQWMQAKMLGEIAYQLAVMNERFAPEDERLQDQVTGQSLMITAIEERMDKIDRQARVPWCGAVSDDRTCGLKTCGLNKGHEGKHGWDR
jgi:hypothetical protein